MFSRIAILGVGLIGGSLGMAVKKDGLAQHVMGFDVSAEILARAQELHAIDDGTLALEHAVKDADLIVLAAPISVNCALAERIRPYVKPHTLVTDVGSTKSQVVTSCQAALGPNITFIGGHPMAGAETAGVDAADPYLLENAVYVLTPTSDVDSAVVDRLTQFVSRLGAKPVTMDPAEHDLVVAAVSHLPHLAASSLVNTAAAVEEQSPLTLMLAAGGFRDTTRIASGDPRLWRDICFSNKEKLLEVISLFRSMVERMEQDITAEDDMGFLKSLADAKTVRDTIPRKLKGYWPHLDEVVVTIPDRPGTIGQVAALLGVHGINIDDIEILRVREGEGGSLRLGFAAENVSDRAVAILEGAGLMARKKT